MELWRYTQLSMKKSLLSSEDFHSYYQNGGALPAHLDKDTNDFIEVSSGSLGHGLPMGLGFALAKKEIRFRL